MHIHGSSMTVHSASLSAAAHDERAAIARRAAETRKRLLSHVEDADLGTSPEEDLMIGHWINVHSGSGSDPGEL
jgi:hypothetical protein